MVNAIFGAREQWTFTKVMEHLFTSTIGRPDRQIAVVPATKLCYLHGDFPALQRQSNVFQTLQRNKILRQCNIRNDTDIVYTFRSHRNRSLPTPKFILPDLQIEIQIFELSNQVPRDENNSNPRGI